MLLLRNKCSGIKAIYLNFKSLQRQTSWLALPAFICVFRAHILFPLNSYPHPLASCWTSLSQIQPNHPIIIIVIYLLILYYIYHNQKTNPSQQQYTIHYYILQNSQVRLRVVHKQHSSFSSFSSFIRLMIQNTNQRTSTTNEEKNQTQIRSAWPG